MFKDIFFRTDKNIILRGAEFFCGTKSFTKIAEKHGIKMFTVDNNLIFDPDLLADLYTMSFEGSLFDILWASPPCYCFSVASISTHWKGGKNAYIPKSDACKISLDMLENIISQIASIKPRFWFIENPRGVMRKVIEPLFQKYGIKDYIRNTVTYCQYGDTRMKPTDIWTNCADWIPRPMCKNGDRCHEEARRGAKTGTQGLKGSIDRSIIPKALCKEIVDVILEG